jgi:lipoyl(octanoyl) transferase
MVESETLRVLDLTFDSGATQLAMTEAILLSVGQGFAPPTLRLYSWSEPVVILGVGQSSLDLDLETCRNRGYHVLRRIGGGTAVYHDADEVSIDLIVQAGTDLGPTDVHAGYRQFAWILAEALRTVDIEPETVTIEQSRSTATDELMRPICFAGISPYEFLHENRKLDGLCQIRRRDAIAYQAAIYNSFPIEPLIASLAHENDTTRRTRAERLEALVTDMTTVRGEQVDYAALQQAIVEAVGNVFSLNVERGTLTEFEQREAERLIKEKYCNDEWTFRR